MNAEIPAHPASHAMLTTAMLALDVLDGEGVGQLRRFLHGRRHPDGGYVGRHGQRDLYYTAFGVESQIILDDCAPHPAWLAGLVPADAGTLDLPHLACLARCLVRLDDTPVAPSAVERLAAQLEVFRAADGGYGLRPGQAESSVYACFLALLTAGDLRLPFPGADVRRAVRALQRADGAFVSGGGHPEPTTTTTAAAVVVLSHLEDTAGSAARDWLLARSHPEGGFCASELAPCPDTLSTATALYALRRLQDLGEVDSLGCFEFITAVWDEASGGFRGHQLDPLADCEYTYYGLLALGCLAPGA